MHAQYDFGVQLVHVLATGALRAHELCIQVLFWVQLDEEMLICVRVGLWSFTLKPFLYYCTRVINCGRS